VLERIASLLTRGGRFLVTTHRDPDVDGVGSMLALGLALIDSGKEVVLLTEKALHNPLNQLKGADLIVQGLKAEMAFDCVFVLDCGDLERLGSTWKQVERLRPLINIDHHETNTGFGHVNLVDPGSSSTAELVYEVIKSSGLFIDARVAENIFAAIQADTGSFVYDNTTPGAMMIAAEMLEYGIRPWEISRKFLNEYSLSWLKLLAMCLETIELHHGGAIGMINVSLEMQDGADDVDGGRLVEYPRLLSGVEVAVLIKETGEGEYRVSLRSNSRVNVAVLASLFGGGGHSRAAGFDWQGSMERLKESFLEAAVRFLDEKRI
jgi:bifunctional oligoribonuclease and PAP phosphatase NrnA